MRGVPERFFRPEDGPCIAERYRAGATAAEIAREWGCSTSAAQRELVRLKVPRRAAVRRPNWTGSDEQCDEAVHMYRTGSSIRVITKHFACSHKTIAAVLRQRDCDVRRGRDQITPERKTALLARAADRAVTVRSLSAEFGLSEGAVSKLLRRSGHSARRNEWTPDREQWVVRQYQAGQSQQQIADQLGVTQSVVSNRLRAAGFVLKRPAARGADHGSWKGGRVVMGGYVYLRPTAADLAYCRPNVTGYVAEHRLVMGRAMGRPVTGNETVHHINGDRTDNRPDNLQLRQGQHGNGVLMKCNECGSHDVRTEALS